MVGLKKLKLIIKVNDIKAYSADELTRTRSIY